MKFVLGVIVGLAAAWAALAIWQGTRPSWQDRAWDLYDRIGSS